MNMHLFTLVKLYQFSVINWNLSGFFRKFDPEESRNILRNCICFFFRRTKSLSPSRVNELKKILQDMGADVGSVKPTVQDCS
jgi:hypothetical protein